MNFFRNWLNRNPFVKVQISNAIYLVYSIHRILNRNLINDLIIDLKPQSSFPRIVHPENINICNSDCVMCPYGSMTRKKGIMSDEIYHKIVNECIIHKEFEELWLYMFGEPLLDKKLFERIKYAKSKGVPVVYLSTNGSLLDDDATEKILNCDLDKILISLDGIKKETYEKLRRGLKFEVVTSNIENFLKKVKSRGLKKPHITIQIIKMDETKEEIKPFVEKWKKLADAVSVVPYHDYAQQNKNKAAWNFKFRARQLPCDYLWEKCTILQNGDVTFCCFDYDGKYIVGNVEQNSIFNIWNGTKMISYRKLHLHKKADSIPLCNDCSLYLDYEKKRISKLYLEFLKRKYIHNIYK